MKNGTSIIMAVSVMDIFTSVLILNNVHALLVARLGFFYLLFPDYRFGALLILGSALLAIFGLTITHKYRWRFLWFLPQHFFLLLATGSIFDYVLMQHYADGVLRPWPFILQDQLPTVILTITYAFAMFDFYKENYG